MNDRIEIESDANKPTLKKNISDKLFVGGMQENLNYVFKGYKNKDLETEDGLKIGERFSLHYCFKPYDASGFAYEHLNLFAGRSWRETEICEFIIG